MEDRGRNTKSHMKGEKQCSKRAENVLRFDERQRSSDAGSPIYPTQDKMKLKSRHITGNYKDDLKAAGEKTDFLQKNNDLTNQLLSCTNEVREGIISSKG